MNAGGSRLACDQCGTLMRMDEERNQLRTAKPNQPMMQSAVALHLCEKCGRNWRKAIAVVAAKMAVV